MHVCFPAAVYDHACFLTLRNSVLAVFLNLCQLSNYKTASHFYFNLICISLITSEIERLSFVSLVWNVHLFVSISKNFYTRRLLSHRALYQHVENRENSYFSAEGGSCGIRLQVSFCLVSVESSSAWKVDFYPRKTKGKSISDTGVDL